MAFTCFGHFGPICPTELQPPEFLSGNGGLGINDEQVPLDIATKIFWSASTYTVEAEMTRTGTEYGTSNSGSRSIVATWGAISGSLTPSQNRPAFTTAREMLCHITSGPNTPHTFARAAGSGQPTIAFSLGKRMLIDGDGIKFPFSAFFDIGNEVLLSVRPYDFQTNLFWSQAEFEANVITPWGNFNLPIYTRSNPEFFIVTGSMTITVAEADPEVRFG